MMRLAAAFVGGDNISGVKARIFPDARSPCFPSVNKGHSFPYVLQKL